MAGRDVSWQHSSGTKLSRNWNSDKQERKQMAENSPDYSVRVINLGLDYIPEHINVFPDVKHC